MAETASGEQGRPRVLVVGCGGIGGIVAANLAEMDVPVTAVTGNPAIAEVLNRQGARVREEGQERVVMGIRALAELPPGAGPFDFILLATQPPAVEEAARRAAPALAPDGRMVCFQNGLCELRVAPIVGADRVLGAIVAWGASMLEPGLYDRTAHGGFVLGRMDGSHDAAMDTLAALLESVGPVETTGNLAGARWSKLAINCAISALGTVGGERLGVLMRQRFIRRLALEIMTEVVQVAHAEGVKLEKVSGTLDLEWLALTPDERMLGLGSPALFAKHTMLVAVGARYRRLRSSMLAAMERGRPPAVDFLNGEIVDRAARHGIPVPVNTEIRARVHRIARGEAKPSMDYARALFDDTRHLRGRDAQTAVPS
ncbi:MAG: 2-dehydropantoate 2-reductase [Deltaproteobacteria bacterium]|nr:2-dehydropantoate 2-reductase [Deltaproteobacteria bacterium]